MQGNADTKADRRLEEKLLLSCHAQGALLADLGIVIHEPDNTEEKGRRDCDPDVVVGHISPEDGRDQNSDHYEKPSHGWGSRLGTVRGWALLPNLLADLELAQSLDQPRTEDQTDPEGGEV